MKVKILSFIVLVFTIGLIFLVFPSEKYENKKKEVVFWTLQLGVFDKYINNIISEFEKDNPEVKIKWVDVPYSEGEKRTLAALLSDNPPDLINLTPDFSAMAAQKNALYQIPKEAMSNFPEGLYSSLSYNEKFFAIPFYLTSAVTFANLDLMKKLQVKTVPVTYDEMFSIAEKIKKETGKYVEMPSINENDTFLKILNKYELNIFEDLKSEKSKEIFKMYEKAYKTDMIPKESLTQSHREALEKYMSGQTVFIQAGTNFLNIVKENAPSIYEDTAIFPQITGSSGKYDFSLMNLIIPQKSKNKDYALKFALFLTNEKNQLELAKLTSVIPANKYTLKNDYFRKNDSKEEIARNISVMQISNLSQGIKNSRHKKNIILLINSTLAEILTGNTELSEGLEKLDKKIKDYEE